MMKIICVGKIKEKFFAEAIKEYQKRISKYTKLEIIEVEDIKGNDINTILLKEKNLIEKHISPKDYVITLEIEGNMYNSQELSTEIEKVQMQNSNITWIIGGSYGLNKFIKERSNESISFSKLTFPHQLFRIILLEQIYRAYKIMHNETYHK